MISNNLKNRIYTSIILIILFFLAVRFNPILIFVLIVLSVLSVIEFLNLTNQIFFNKLYLFITNSLFIFYIFSFCFLLFFFSHLLEFKIILMSLFLGCVASDIGGFVTGKIFKGPKLTKISPNKTISGAIGSIILTIIVMSSIIFYFTKNLSYIIILSALVTSITCQAGDLFFSYLKRIVKIKDTGNFLPGHGGILDRIDGILFGVPIGFLTLILFI
jgi:phosphatidate cytidylyltransferase